MPRQARRCGRGVVNAPYDAKTPSNGGEGAPRRPVPKNLHAGRGMRPARTPPRERRRALVRALAHRPKTPVAGFQT